MDLFTMLSRLKSNSNNADGFNQVLREYAAYRLDGKRSLEGTTPEQAKHLEKAANVSMKLAKTLTEEQMGLLLDYESAAAECWLANEEEAYLLGLKDGLTMAEILKHFNITPPPRESERVVIKC